MAGYHSGLIYIADFVPAQEKKQFLTWLKRDVYPIWEQRFSASNPPPAGEENRKLLRPVYWLGNWQFACLNYYHPPKGIFNRCITAEPFPEVLQNWVRQAEAMVHDKFQARDIPRGWHLNTCLINYYGAESLEDGKKRDAARVGEHKDFEPGPVASVSFGERAIFQFVRSAHRNAQSEVVLQQRLEDCSLQIFGGDKFKKHLFHRVQRVEDKLNSPFNVNTDNFETRRINLTFRYVPLEHYVDLKELPENLRQDILPYVEQLATKNSFWSNTIKQ